tara:strand:+ start:1629 stop:2363 length:735 start_codon:yes stop_codon:yes gene_type:complete
MRDEVYSTVQPHIVDFAFTEEVARVFPDMIRRSVPGYETIIPMTGLISANHLKSDDKVVDLGCSLGATSQAIAALTELNIKIIGIDNSTAMISSAQKANADPRIEFVQADILSSEALNRIHGAKVIVMNFILQFCPPDERKRLLQSVHNAMAPDGLLILSEKVCDEEATRHAYFDATHLAWKRANGYSDLEVSQKRTALEEVMKVDSEEIHTERLHAAGFQVVDQWYKCMNWASFLAWVDPLER